MRLDGGDTLDLEITGSNLDTVIPVTWSGETCEGESTNNETYWPSATNYRAPCLNHLVHVATPMPRGIVLDTSSLSLGGFLFPANWFAPTDPFLVRETVRTPEYIQYSGVDDQNNQWLLEFRSDDNIALRPVDDRWELQAFPGDLKCVVSNASFDHELIFVYWNSEFIGSLPIGDLPPVRCTLIGTDIEGTDFEYPRSLQFYQPADSPCGQELASPFLFGYIDGETVREQGGTVLWDNLAPEFQIRAFVAENRSEIRCVYEGRRTFPTDRPGGIVEFQRTYCFTDDEVDIGDTIVNRYRLFGIGMTQVFSPNFLPYFTNASLTLGISFAGGFSGLVFRQLGNSLGAASFEIHNDFTGQTINEPGLSDQGGTIAFDIVSEVLGWPFDPTIVSFSSYLQFAITGTIIDLPPPALSNQGRRHQWRLAPYIAVNPALAPLFSQKMTMVLDGPGNVLEAPGHGCQRIFIQRN